MAETDKALNEQATVDDPFGTSSNDEEYTQEETEEAQKAVEELDNDSGDYQHEADENNTEDITEDASSEETTGTYQSRIASVLACLAGALKQFSVTQGIGNWLEKVAATVEGSSSSKPDGIIDVTDRTDVVKEMDNIDSEEMLDSLNQSAALITSGQGDNNTTIAGALGEAINESALSNPSETAQALQIYNDAAEQAIAGTYAEGSAEYNQAMSSLGVVNASMVGSFYETLMEGELSGKTVDEETLYTINTLDVTGVNTSYSNYVPGADVSLEPDLDSGVYEEHEALVEEGYKKNQNLQASDDSETLKTSSASVSQTEENQSVLGNGDFDTQRMHDLGVQDIDEEADSKTLLCDQIDDNFTNIQNVYASSDSQKMNDALHDSYAEMINGISAYNNGSVEEIKNKYEPDSEERQNATNTLAETMRAGVEEVFSALKTADEAFGFLTDEDKSQLDNLQITGVNVKFSDYQVGMDLKTGEMPEVTDTDSDEQYADIGTADASGRWDTSNQANSSVFTNENYSESQASYQADSGEDKKLNQHPYDRTAETENLEERLNQGQAEQQAEENMDIPYPGSGSY